MQEEKKASSPPDSLLRKSKLISAVHTTLSYHMLSNFEMINAVYGMVEIDTNGYHMFNDKGNIALHVGKDKSLDLLAILKDNDKNHDYYIIDGNPSLSRY